MPHIKNALIRYRIIDRCIRNKYKPYPSKRDLREACEEALFGSMEGDNICDSTIEKDMFAMKMDHDAPIKYSRVYGGYYYTEEDFSINDIPLTEEDLSAIKFAVNTLSQFREVNLFKQFGSAIDKIVDRVSISTNGEENEWDEYVQFETSTSTSGNDYLNPLLEAIKNKLQVQFTYGTFQSGKLKTRIVSPLLLKEYSNRWYLISFDIQKEKITTYALDRMKDLEITADAFERPADFNSDIYFKYAFGITNNGSLPEKIVFKVDLVASKYIESQPLHRTQKTVKVGKNKVTFEINVIISEEFIRTLLSYGSELEVLAPLELRNEVKKRIQKTIELYT